MLLNTRAVVGLFLLLLAPLPVQADPAVLDVRLVVDISGSMKQNDPHNLRRPAVRMISELLDEGSVAGIWTFGEYVNMLVPHGSVDRDWRDYAVSQAQQINSVALHTNIGAALEVASDDFDRDQHRDNTHFILLTDGMVDVAPGDQEAALVRNQAERERILDQVVPRLADKGARIHAIALSENTDQSLLKQLARATNGSYSLAQTDQSLSRAFLDALNRSRPTEEVPLEGNRFPIDDRISEFTAIIFHGPGGAALGLRSPAGLEYLEPEASRDPENAPGQAGENPAVRWVTGSDYALVTVESPVGGEWEILGSLDEGSRVKVVSDLSMKVTDLPGHFFADQPMHLSIAFEEAGSVITDPDVLRFLTVEMSLLTGDGRTGTKELSTPGQVPEDGIYRDLISRLSQPGEYTFTVTADGKTFQRQSRQTVVLRPPLDVDIKGEGSGRQSFFAIEASIGQPNLAPTTARVFARVTGPDQDTRVVPLTRDGNTDQEEPPWLYNLSTDRGDGEYSVVVELQAQTTAGRDVAYSTRPIVLVLPRSDSAAEYQTIDGAAPAVSADTAGPPQSNLEEEPASPDLPGEGAGNAASGSAQGADPVVAEQAQTDESKPGEAPGTAEEQSQNAVSSLAFSSLWLWGMVGAGLTVGAGLGGWLLYRRRPGASPEDPEGDLSAGPTTSAPEQPETQEMPDAEVAEVAGGLDEKELAESDADADALVAEVMAEFEADADARPEDVIAEDPATVDDGDEEEFSLEDFDLSDVDDLTAEGDLQDSELGEDDPEEPPLRR